MDGNRIRVLVSVK